MRLICFLLCAIGVVLTGTVALAVSPAARLPSGAVIDLNRNVLIEPDGDHRQLSATQVRQHLQHAAEVRAQRARQSAGARVPLPSAAQEQSQ